MTNLTVTGAGTYNGRYNPKGKFNGRKQWEKRNSGWEQHQIYFVKNSQTEFWVLGNSNGYAYKARVLANAPRNAVPADGWRDMSGKRVGVRITGGSAVMRQHSSMFQAPSTSTSAPSTYLPAQAVPSGGPRPSAPPPPAYPPRYTPRRALLPDTFANPELPKFEIHIGFQASSTELEVAMGFPKENARRFAFEAERFDRAYNEMSDAFQKMSCILKRRSLDATLSDLCGGEIRECRVCLEETVTNAMVPCGHLCVCEACAHKIFQSSETQRPTCPLCRVELSTHVKIY